MKYLKTYGGFITEKKKALLPSQFRKYMKHFDRKRYAEIFQKYKEKYEGDRNAYRIYLPLIVTKRDNPVEDEIKYFLEEKGYTILDYFKGSCKYKTGKNPAKIGSVLTRFKELELMKKFVEDPERKKGDAEELMVCVSRHPYDIAGSDTDRNWTNCFTLPLSKKQPRLKALLNELEELKADQSTEVEMPKKVRLNKEIRDLELKIAGYTKEGENTKYLKHEVKEGSLVTFLIKKDDKNLNNPLSVLNIKPYLNDKGDVYLKTCYTEYGVDNEDFRNTVFQWLKEVNEGKKGIFYINPNVYSDRDDPEVNTEGVSIKDILEGDYGKENTEYTTWMEAFINERGLTRLEGLDMLSKDLKTLNVSRNKITDLEGISELKNLTTLCVEDNYLTHLKGVEKLENLKILDCGDNNITNIDNNIEPLSELKELYCNDNKLSTLYIDKLPNLKKLYCGGNRLTDIYLDNCKLLEFDCNSNNLSELDLEPLKNVKVLNVAKNRLSRLDGFEELKALRSFSYGKNFWDYPIPGAYAKFGNQYTNKNRELFATYESQKAFLEKYPEFFKELEFFGVNPQIKNEFPDLKWTPERQHTDDEEYYDDEEHDEDEEIEEDEEVINDEDFFDLEPVEEHDEDEETEDEEENPENPDNA